MSFWYFYFKVWSFLIITARDTPSKNVILILSLGNLECPYNYQMKLLLIKKMILIFLIRNLKYPYNHHLKYMPEQKWFWYFYLEMWSALISNARDILIKKPSWNFHLGISSAPKITAWNFFFKNVTLLLFVRNFKCSYNHCMK